MNAILKDKSYSLNFSRLWELPKPLYKNLRHRDSLIDDPYIVLDFKDLEVTGIPKEQTKDIPNKDVEDEIKELINNTLKTISKKKCTVKESDKPITSHEVVLENEKGVLNSLKDTSKKASILALNLMKFKMESENLSCDDFEVLEELLNKSLNFIKIVNDLK